MSSSSGTFTIEEQATQEVASNIPLNKRYKSEEERQEANRKRRIRDREARKNATQEQKDRYNERRRERERQRRLLKQGGDPVLSVDGVRVVQVPGTTTAAVPEEDLSSSDSEDDVPVQPPPIIKRPKVDAKSSN